MSSLGIFVVFVLPALVLGMGGALVWLEGRADRRRGERQTHPAQ